MNRLTIIQKPEGGFLSGPKSVNFSVCHNGINYKITVDQRVAREIRIVSPKGGINRNMLDTYYTLETLLMLLDGQFYPVDSAFDNDTDITQSWIKRTLPSYHSADFVIGTSNTLVDFTTVLDARLFSTWHILREELDLIHKMVLYCLSSVKMPKDMQCAFMVEAFEGLKDLVKQRNSAINFSKVEHGKSQLQKDLSVFASNFGTGIFEKEIQCNLEKFTEILVNSRNRIAHIKSKQNRVYLDGGENVIYLMKLFLLYRVVLFSFLGIADDLYSDNLALHMLTINDHDVMKNFLKKLGDSHA